MLIQLDEIKKHLNIDADFHDDDQYLMYLGQVAEDIVQKHIDRTFDDIIENDGVVPTPLHHSVLLLIGNLYDNRESVSYTSAVEVPNTLTYILSMYRDYNNANI